MIVELRHCDLEIGHVGTQEEIAFQICYENLEELRLEMSAAFEDALAKLNKAKPDFCKSIGKSLCGKANEGSLG